MRGIAPDPTIYRIICRHCRAAVTEDAYRVACPSCGGPLDFQYAHRASFSTNSCPTMWKYREFLPVQPDSKIVTLQEGFTPLQKARCHPDVEVYFKNEALNPTGSHKDRTLSVGVTKAVEFGYDTVMVYSDGSAALSSAAYAACAGLKNITLVARGRPNVCLLPLMIYNSIVLEYQGSAAQALDWVHAACQSLGIYETSTYRRANPYGSEGPKTIGYEVFEQLGESPDWFVVPVGGGGTLAGIWRAFLELESRGLISKRPRMVGVLPEGCSLLETALSEGIETERELRSLAPKEVPPTLQVKIAMAYPPDGLEAIAAVRESRGMFVYASDGEALAAQKRLGTYEGIYAELSAAASLVGVDRLLSKEIVGEGETLVAVVTGSGFRETVALADRMKVEKTRIDGGSGFKVLEQILERNRGKIAAGGADTGMISRIGGSERGR